MAEQVIDAWIQHPTEGLANHEMFESLRRWMGVDAIPAVPLEFTLGAMKRAGTLATRGPKR